MMNEIEQEGVRGKGGVGGKGGGGSKGAPR